LVAADLVRDAADDAQYHRHHHAVLPLDHTHIFATWAFRVGIEGSDLPLGASVSLFMVPILAVAAVFILRDINKRGNEA
jgi:ABC-type polysaccharide transport system permease subunit